jgi:hypothetical protein
MLLLRYFDVLSRMRNAAPGGDPFTTCAAR